VKKILIVDNNRTIVEMLSHALASAGYQPMKTFDGMEALDRMRKERPDLAVVDLIMPKIDGYRLTRIMRSDPELSSIPIIILTGVAAEDSAQMFAVDGDAFIAKGRIDQTAHHILTTIKWLEARQPMRDKVVGLENLYPREITRELLLVKDHFDSMLQVMAEGVLEMDEHHRIFFANSSACRLLDMAEGDIFGRMLSELFPDEPDVPPYLVGLASSPGSPLSALTLQWHDRFIRLQASPFFHQQTFVGSIAVLEDVTLRLKKERALEELTTKIFDSAPLGMALLDGDRRILLANDAFRALSLEQGEILSRDFLSLPAFAHGTFAAALESLSPPRPGATVRHEASFSPPGGGRDLTYHLVAAPLFQQNGVPFLLVMLEDVSERADLERQLVTTNRQLEQANQAKSNFLSIVSHELRTPLSVVRGYISLILEGKIPGADGEAVVALRVADKRARLLQHLIEELLDLSRIESGKITFREEALSLPKHIREVAEMFSTDLERKRIILTLDLPSDLDPVLADHDRIHQIFTNLVGNAVKFTPEGGSITVRGRPIMGGVSIAVTDTGIGIPADKLPLIFNRFYQVDSSDTRLHGGTGLGLSIVKMILDVTGGSISVESTPGVGSTFTLFLPTGDVEAHREVAPPPPPPLPRDKEETRTILICEDDPDTVSIITYTLKDAGHRLIICQDCLEALQSVFTTKVDLLLVDIRLPHLDGYDFCRMLRVADASRQIPVIILSAAGQESEIKRGFECGANEYMIKPFLPSDLLERIRRYLP
jgi:signal transduction histidine kinase/DNA-binding response OmpR family regulator